jgi:hypothetical protein
VSPWGKTSDRDEQRRRGDALTSALDADASSPRGGRGSRGGAPIWVLHGEGFGLMPSPCTCGSDGPARTSSVECPRHGPRRRLKRLMDKGAREGGRWGPREGPNAPPYREALAGGHEREFSNGPAYEGPRGIPYVSDEQAVEDPDGFAVFGRYPKGFLRHALKIRLLGDVQRGEVLHVCSGTLGPEERWTVDIRPEAKPRVVADGCRLPFRDDAFKAVMIDPPYSDAYARNLYGLEMPRNSWLLKEAARVVVPCGRIGLMHVAIPFAPPGCRLVRVYPVSTGVGFRIRALTIYERRQDDLPFTAAASPLPIEELSMTGVLPY